MQKRDTFILTIAVISGIMAFLLVVNLLRKPAAPRRTITQKVGVKSIAVPEGFRAITLSAKEIENIPPVLRTGSYLDLLGSAPNYEGKMELQTIIRGAQVINVEKNKKEEDAVQSITLALTPVGTEVLMKAKSEGKIHLVLRPEHDAGEPFQLGNVGITEVIRGVNRDKSVRMEK